LNDRQDLAKLFLGNAVGFHIVAKHIAQKNDWATFPWPPFFVNVGHAIELSLKAYILCRGGTEKDCRCIGHDLHNALATACRLGLPTPAASTHDLIDRIEPYYMDHSFRYFRKKVCVEGLPNPQDALGATERLLGAVLTQLPNLQPD
jgi:hypothetical protein